MDSVGGNYDDFDDGEWFIEDEDGNIYRNSSEFFTGMFVMFWGGIKDGLLWRNADHIEDPFFECIGHIPKHGKTRHVYKLHKANTPFWVYEYRGVQVRNGRGKWTYA